MIDAKVDRRNARNARRLIGGVFAMGWFGWHRNIHRGPGRDGCAPARRRLGVGSASAALILVVAAVLAWKLWGTGTVFDADTGRAFGIVVGAGFGLAGVGAGLLTWRGRKELVPVWIALVVGVHLLPLGVTLLTAAILSLADALARV